MKKILRITMLILILAMTASSFVFAFAKRPQATSAEATLPSKKYICPMRCVLSEKAGKCPKCGMEMWEVSI